MFTLPHSLQTVEHESEEENSFYFIGNEVYAVLIGRTTIFSLVKFYRSHSARLIQISVPIN